MKKLLTYIAASLLYISVQAQDVVVDVLKWNINPDPYTSFWQSSAISSPSYTLGIGLTSGGGAGDGYSWRGITTGGVLASDKISIEFTVSNNIVEITNIEFSAGNFDNFGLGWRVNYYQLDYVVNGTDTVSIIELPNGNISFNNSGGALDNKSIDLNTPVVLEPGDTFELIWYPFDADQDDEPEYTQFFLADSTLVGGNKVRIGGVIRSLSTVNSVTDFTYTSGCASAGTLSWTNPSPMTNKTVLVFAKKTNYIDQGTPEQDPTTYGIPLSDLTTLNNGTFNPNIGYDYSFATDNDPDAMLIYSGTGTSVDLTNFENAIDYQFAAFVYDNTGTPLKYSNAQLTSGNSASTLNDIVSYTSLSKPEAADITFVKPNCYHNIMIVANDGDAIIGAPAQGVLASDFTASNDWDNPGSLFGTTGHVVYVGVGTEVNIYNLQNLHAYGISIWVEESGNWSSGTYFSVYPDDYEVIITQVKPVDAVDNGDVVEFLTLKEIEFSTANYNLGSFPVCEDGLMRTSSPIGKEVTETFFDGLEINGVTGIIPAGTFIRVISGSAGTTDFETNDGIATIYAGTSLALEDDGDQAMVYIGNAVGTLDSDCGPDGSTPNSIKSAINYGNDGWIEPGSAEVPSSLSFAPSSVSNLAQPAGIPDLYPNYSLKDQYTISGDIAAIHATISETDNSNIWFANNDASISIVKLKDIQFDATNSTSSAGWLSSENSGEVDIDLNQLSFADETDTRYMIVVNSVFQGETPADRYTCYTGITTDYSTTDDVVTLVENQVSAQDPCGTPTTGLGHVVYLNRVKTGTVNVTGLPCGTRVFVDVYAVKGNGYTMSLGTPASSDVLLDISTPTTYYSQGTGGNVDGAIWNTSTSGTGAVISEFSSCVNLVIQAGHTVIFNQTEMEIGSLTIETGGIAEVLGTNILTIERDFTIDGSFLANNSTINLDGKYGGTEIETGVFLGAQVVSGLATDLTFCKLRVNNTSPTIFTEVPLLQPDNNNVNFNIDAKVTYGMRVDDGDFIIGGAYTITLVSDAADYAAYLGALGGPDANATASISGNINAQRFFPPISTVADADAGQYGTGWRYIGAPVENADFFQIMDNFPSAGFLGSLYPDFFDANGYYFPTIKKYDETVLGTITEGFDSDYDGANVPEIYFRRNTANASEIEITKGEGVLVYVSSIEYPSLNSVTYDVIGQPVTGDVPISLSYSTTGTNSDDGWQLLANPYPCAIDWYYVDIDGPGAGIDGTIYIYNAETGAYETRNRDQPGQYIAAHQAFWVKVNNTGITLTFLESIKHEEPNVPFYKDNDELYAESLKINVIEADSLYGNSAIIWFKENATFAFDHEYDAYKLEEFGDHPVLSSNIDGFEEPIFVNTIPQLEVNHVITFNLNVKVAGDYTISFEENGYILQGSCVTMTDLVNDSTFMVDVSTVYSFYSELRADTAAPMFSMTISPSVSIESTNATCFEGNNGSATALGVGDGPFTYSWYDANNELVFEETTSSASTVDSLMQGFYSVEIDGNNTFCELTSNEIYVSQPTPFVNSTVITNPLSCTYADGFIYVTLDERAVWDITWTNIETGYSNQALSVTGMYEISNLGPGTYEVVTTTDCGEPIVFEETLTDNNDVVANFTMAADTIWLADGGEAEFFNTSENSDSWYWLYNNASVEPDTSFDGSYTYTEAGVYGVTLIAQNGETCSNILTQELVVMGDPNSVDDLTNEIVLSYISYTSGNAQYVIELKEAKNVQIQMLNSMGQVINTQEVNVDGKTFVDLSTYDLSSGIYIIITLDDGTRIDSKKLFVR